MMPYLLAVATCGLSLIALHVVVRGVVGLMDRCLAREIRRRQAKDYR